MAGFFITFEGGEGAGKSTQIERLASHFRATGKAVVMTREPGGVPAAEDIRALLVNGDPGKWSATAEALLNYAAREVHISALIRPALKLQQTLLCDRFMDSTRAYQGYAGGCDLALLDRLEQTVVGDTMPDLTFVFDLDPAVGLQRAQKRGQGVEDRYERKGLAFHQALRRGFLEIAKAAPQRCVVIDASQTMENVWISIVRALNERGHG
jgi:dTMP kinase